MNTENTENDTIREWLFYDGECPLCLRALERVRKPLVCHHFGFVAQQSEFGQRTLGLRPGEVCAEMKIMNASGEILGGSEAFLHIARLIWWAKPIYYASKIPGVGWLINLIYRKTAANRYCISQKCWL